MAVLLPRPAGLPHRPGPHATSTQANLPPGSSGTPARHRRPRLRRARPADVRRARPRSRSASRPVCSRPLIGTLWGAVAGYVGGWVDAVMMRVIDAALAIPALFLLVVVARSSPRAQPVLILIIGLRRPGSCPARLVRAEALTLRNRDYVQAMRLMGGARGRAVFRHIVPNADRHDHRQRHVPGRRRDPATSPTCRFLGLGVPPPADRLGRHAVRRHHLHPGRLLVADLPAGHRDRPRRRARSTSSATGCATPSTYGLRAPMSDACETSRTLAVEIEDLRTDHPAAAAPCTPSTGSSLDLAPGEALGIVGESGCGKTMTALSSSACCRRRRRSPAAASRFGRHGPGQRAPEPALRGVRGNTIGMVFQDPLTSLNPTMTIGAAGRRSRCCCTGGVTRTEALAAAPRRCCGWSACRSPTSG